MSVHEMTQLFLVRVQIGRELLLLIGRWFVARKRWVDELYPTYDDLVKPLDKRTKIDNKFLVDTNSWIIKY